MYIQNSTCGVQDPISKYPKRNEECLHYIGFIKITFILLLGEFSFLSRRFTVTVMIRCLYFFSLFVNLWLWHWSSYLKILIFAFSKIQNLATPLSLFWILPTLNVDWKTKKVWRYTCPAQLDFRILFCDFTIRGYLHFKSKTRTVLPAFRQKIVLHIGFFRCFSRKNYMIEWYYKRLFYV